MSEKVKVSTVYLLFDLKKMVGISLLCLAIGIVGGILMLLCLQGIASPTIPNEDKVIFSVFLAVIALAIFLGGGGVIWQLFYLPSTKVVATEENSYLEVEGDKEEEQEESRPVPKQ